MEQVPTILKLLCQTCVLYLAIHSSVIYFHQLIIFCVRIANGKSASIPAPIVYPPMILWTVYVMAFH
jgi:hypothetical protein